MLDTAGKSVACNDVQVIVIKLFVVESYTEGFRLRGAKSNFADYCVIAQEDKSRLSLVGKRSQKAAKRKLFASLLQ